MINIPGCWVFVLARPISSEWLRNRNASSGKGESGSVNSWNEVDSLNRIIKDESVSQKFCAHLETSKPDTENIVPTCSFSRNCGRRPALIVTCITVDWNTLKIISVLHQYKLKRIISTINYRNQNLDNKQHDQWQTKTIIFVYIKGFVFLLYNIRSDQQHSYQHFYKIIVNCIITLRIYNFQIRSASFEVFYNKGHMGK